MAFAVRMDHRPCVRQDCSDRCVSWVAFAIAASICVGRLAIASCLRDCGLTLVPSGLLFLLALRVGGVDPWLEGASTAA